MTTKPTNPKDLVGSGKVPMSLFPDTAIATGAMGLLDGMLKYGRCNWREAGVRLSIYLDAIERHLAKVRSGEDVDQDSGLDHWSHILACAAIIVDARACGKLTDDRPPAVPFSELLAQLTPEVARLKELHKDKAPHHAMLRRGYGVDDIYKAAALQMSRRVDD